MIELKQVDKYFNKKRNNEIHVINNVSLSLPDSGLIAFFGKSGCGKTTLLNVIGGLDNYSSGSIEIEDVKMTKKNTDELRNKYVGYIFQNYYLDKKISVFDNIANAVKLMGEKRPSVIKEKVDCALACVDMAKFGKRLPTSLSGGQQQRVAIARAIVKSPKIILADEPTGNLDMVNTIKIMNILKEISKDRLVLLVTHEENLVKKYCDTVIQFSDGKIEADVKNFATGKTKNDMHQIYLQDMEKNEVQQDGFGISLYGDVKCDCKDIRIICNEGKLYLQCLNDKIKIVDGKGELQIIEGSREDEMKLQNEALDMSALTPIENAKTKTGRLFTFKSSVIDGYRDNFQGVKKGKKSMITIMALMSVFIIFVVSMFGTAITTLNNIDDGYSHNVVLAEINSQADIDAVMAIEDSNRQDATLIKGYHNFSQQDNRNCMPYMLKDINFSVGNFQSQKFESEVTFGGDVFPIANLEGKKIVKGVGTVGEGEVVITTSMADEIIEKSKISFIKNYDDVLMLVAGIGSRYYYEHGSAMTAANGGKVVGIVEDSDNSLFINFDTFNTFPMFYDVFGVSNYDKAKKQWGTNDELKDGEIILVRSGFAISDRDFMKRYQVGGTFSQFGKDFKIAKIVLMEHQSDDFVYDPMNEGSVWYDNGSWCIMTNNDIKANKNSFVDRKKITGTDGHASSQSYIKIVTKDVEATYNQLLEKTNLKISKSTDQKQMLMGNAKTEIVVKSVILAFGIIILAVLMYFIARSAVISRIKEVGIYRAIGATRNNIMFKFTVEILVLTTLTILISFILASILIDQLVAAVATTIGMALLYYPWWLALCTLAGLYIVSVGVGVLPVWSLMRLTPAQIMAKYDI